VCFFFFFLSYFPFHLFVGKLTTNHLAFWRKGVIPGPNSHGLCFLDLNLNHLIITKIMLDVVEAELIQNHRPGLLMSASIPTRVTRYSTQKYNKPPWTFIGFPSKSADAAGQSTRVNIGGLIYVRREEKDVLETNYYNPFRTKAIDRTQADKIEQNDFLDLAQDVLKHVSRNALVYHTWGREITTVLNRLLGERTRIRHNYPNSHQQHWAREWRFDVPVYEKGTVLWGGSAYWNMELNVQTGQWTWAGSSGRTTL
jgi:hypothetical protein